MAWYVRVQMSGGLTDYSMCRRNAAAFQKDACKKAPVRFYARSSLHKGVVGTIHQPVYFGYISMVGHIYAHHGRLSHDTLLTTRAGGSHLSVQSYSVSRSH